MDYTLRADSLCNLFVMLAILFFFKSLDSVKTKDVIYVVLCSLIAIFSKQSAIQILVYFSVIYLLLCPKKLINYILILLILSSLFCLFFYLIYGNLFFYSTIMGISNPADLKLGISLFFDYTKRFGILLFISILTYFFKNNENSKNALHIKILFFFFIASFIFSFGTSQKVGAGLNYYTLNIYVSVLMVSIFINRLYNSELFQFKNLFLVVLISISSCHIFIERMYNRHLPQISSNHKTDYTTDLYFVNQVKHKIGLAKNQNYLFTPNKNIKNLYFYNTVLPNTEYYGAGVSKFSWKKFDNKKLKYIIINENDPTILNVRTFEQFRINLSDYTLLYKYKNRKLLCLKTL